MCLYHGGHMAWKECPLAHAKPRNALVKQLWAGMPETPVSRVAGVPYSRFAAMSLCGLESNSQQCQGQSVDILQGFLLQPEPLQPFTAFFVLTVLQHPEAPRKIKALLCQVLHRHW